ncbi:MAG: Holliday junction branch migration DNA helicase RuvB [Chthoniobacterales bacterium]|nr:Holliday junction branch migration DNA helicase RuvB [Chthoniobacterales bacterium]
MPSESFSLKTELPDTSLDISLRPPLFEDFCGQVRTTERLQLLVEAASGRAESLQHILLSGPPGLGKTTLAYILGNAMGAEVKTTSGPAIEKAGDLAGLLTTMPRGGVLFIDEIHRLQPAIEEYLYPAMEDFCVDIMIDQGPNARSVRLNLAPFTLIGATTRAGMISAPLRSRFGMNCRLDYYEASELQKIILRTGKLLKANIDKEGALEIARRSRGTPRIANNLLRWVRDFAQVRAKGIINQETASKALSMLEIDKDGFDEMDKRILEAIVHKFGGGPVGLHSLAVAVGEEAGTLEEVHEPYLIMQGYLQRTPQGRVATAKVYQKLGLPMPKK